jgi:hypothetical protein
MVFKNQLTALSKGGTVTKHKGKGSQMAPMPDRSQISSLAQPANQSIGNYAKATPMAQPTPSPQTGAVPGLGNGNWPGNGQ